MTEDPQGEMPPPLALEQPEARGGTNPVTAFLAALQFLLVSPAFIRRAFTARELGAAVGLYPLVGLLLGGMLAGVLLFTEVIFRQPVGIALVIAAWVLLTGALHLDGFLDSCDGLFGGWTPQKRLEIMRDHHIGAYALAGGVLLLLLKFSTMLSLSIGRAAAALVLATVLGRWGISVAVAAFPYARSEGMGRQIKDHAGFPQALLATLLAAAVLGYAWLGLGVSPWICLAAAGAAVLVLLGVSTFTLRRIPGLTGDVYGAINELIELAVLLVFAAGWWW